LEDMQRLVRDFSPLLPLGPIPAPPAPLSLGSRTRARYRAAHELWVIAERCRVTLNALGAPGGRVEFSPVTTRRVRRRGGCEEEAHRRLLNTAKRTRDACRESIAMLPTGAALVSSLCKASQPDAYGQFQKGSVYLPFEADRVVEPALDAPLVRMLDALPPAFAALYSTPSAIMKPTTSWPADMPDLLSR
jgi:hypothetical protein